VRPETIRSFRSANKIAGQGHRADHMSPSVSVVGLAGLRYQMPSADNDAHPLSRDIQIGSGVGSNRFSEFCAHMPFASCNSNRQASRARPELSRSSRGFA
jgi:hypothetical protein